MGNRLSPATLFLALGLRHTLRRSSPPSHLCSKLSLSIGLQTPINLYRKQIRTTRAPSCIPSLLYHVLLHVYVPTFLLSVAGVKERCDKELLPWAEVLNLKAAFLVSDLGLITAMEQEEVEEGWWWQGILAAILVSGEKKGQGVGVHQTTNGASSPSLGWEVYIYRRWTWQHSTTIKLFVRLKQGRCWYFTSLLLTEDEQGGDVRCQSYVGKAKAVNYFGCRTPSLASLGARRARPLPHKHYHHSCSLIIFLNPTPMTLFF